jgi:hypothetical protein
MVEQDSTGFGGKRVRTLGILSKQVEDARLSHVA